MLIQDKPSALYEPAPSPEGAGRKSPESVLEQNCISSHRIMTPSWQPAAPAPPLCAGAGCDPAPAGYPPPAPQMLGMLPVPAAQAGEAGLVVIAGGRQSTGIIAATVAHTQQGHRR